MKSKFLALLLGLALVGCGAKNKQVSDNPGEKIGNKVTLALFAAPWCGPCKRSIPEIQKGLDNLSTAQKEALTVVLYVITGASPSDPPTQEVADQYLNRLGVKGRAVPDPRAKKFREILELDSESVAIPAGAILDADGKVVERYRPGDAFVAKEIVSRVSGLLK